MKYRHDSPRSDVPVSENTILAVALCAGHVLCSPRKRIAVLS